MPLFFAFGPSVGWDLRDILRFCGSRLVSIRQTASDDFRTYYGPPEADWLLPGHRTCCHDRRCPEDRKPGRSPRIRAWTVAASACGGQHLPYLLNPGLCHVVLTYPETGPCMSASGGFVGSQLCTRASFRRALAGTPLPSANVYVNDINH